MDVPKTKEGRIVAVKKFRHRHMGESRKRYSRSVALNEIECTFG